MTKPLCIYHGACDDGFGAAWIVHRALRGEVELHPGIYGKAPPDVSGRDVLLVDFSYKRSALNEMTRQAKSVLILDHHKTAAEDLSGLLSPPSFEAWRDAAWNGNLSVNVRVAALFDMERSGAGLAWDYFFSAAKRPTFVNYLEDRDLWRKLLPGGDEFTIALRSYPQTIETWSDLFDRGADSLIAEGKSIQRYYRLRVDELKRSSYEALLDGHRIWIANAPYFAASEVAGELCERGAVFGACYFEVEKGKFQYSLRSRGDFDVSAVAKVFGGGGHRNAAGFTTVGMTHAAIAA